MYIEPTAVLVVDIDKQECEVGQKIYSIIKKFSFIGKMAVKLIVVYPSTTLAYKNSLSVVNVDYNIQESDNDFIVDSFRKAPSLTDYLIPNKMFCSGGIYATHIPIVNSYGNEYTCVRFYFWTPEEEGRKLIRHITAAVEDIWTIFLFHNGTIH